MEEKLMGKTAGEIFDYYNVGSKDLQMLDEPPGVLSAVSFNVRKDDRVEEVYLWLNDQPPLVSNERLWNYESIRKVKVIKITHDPYN